MIKFIIYYILYYITLHYIIDVTKEILVDG